MYKNLKSKVGAQIARPISSPNLI